MRIALTISAIALAFSCAGCVKVYKMEIQQGNLVGQEMIDKLKPGMTRAQVRFVLGTPLITDSFHADRWDYVYFSRKSAGAPAEMRRLTAIFNGDTLARLEGDVTTALPQPPGEPERAETPAPNSEPLSRAD